MDRRKALGLAGAGALGAAALGAVAGRALDGSAGEHAAAGPGPAAAVPFYGANQAGIVTPMQDHLHFVAFDVITTKREALVEMLQNWTFAAARMTAGPGGGRARRGRRAAGGAARGHRRGARPAGAG
jgi:deferrochelatase/peroxidase EfeB